MAVRDAVEREIERMRKRDADLADGVFAATALALADQLDDSHNSATSKSMCAHQLRETMNRLLELLPEAEEQDSIDELQRRREQRRAGGARA